MAEAAGLRERLQSAPRIVCPNRKNTTSHPDTSVRSSATHPHIDRVPFRGGKADTISFDCKPHPAFGSRLDLLAQEIRGFERDGDDLLHRDRQRRPGRTAQRTDRRERTTSTFIRSSKSPIFNGGFVCHEAGIAVLTDHEIFGRHHRRVRRKKFKEGVAISDYTALEVGDYVVHTEFGIAKYLGFADADGRQPQSRLSAARSMPSTDRLYVPIEEFNRVSKYSGKDGAPQLTASRRPRMGQAQGEDQEGDRRHGRGSDQAVRRATKVDSRGSRSATIRSGSSSSKRRFRTRKRPIRQRAIDDVKRDMADEKPMDRLVCGDVGYGKTEVAVRAAFKAIDAGKQVAVLVPTTILAQQHFATFSRAVVPISRFGSRCSPDSAPGNEQIETASKRIGAGEGRSGDRHPSAALERCHLQGPRPADHR